jgi:hypothetical protein
MNYSTYKDVNNELKNMLLNNEGMTAITDEEYEKIKDFIESDVKNKKFNVDVFGERLAEKEETLNHLLNNFFFNESFIYFSRVKDFIFRVSLDNGYNDYEEIMISLDSHVNFLSFQDNWYALAKDIIKFLNKHYGYKMNLKAHRNNIMIEYWKQTSLIAYMFIPKRFNFKISDLNSLITIRKSKWLSYMSFNDLLVAPAKFIENNERNKKFILKLMKSNGVGLNAIVPGIKFTESEVKKYIIPALNILNSRIIEDLEDFFIKFIETQNHLKDETIMKILTHLNQNKLFIKMIKKNKKIRKIYANRPTIELFIEIL